MLQSFPVNLDTILLMKTITSVASVHTGTRSCALESKLPGLKPRPTTGTTFALLRYGPECLEVV